MLTFTDITKKIASFYSPPAYIIKKPKTTSGIDGHIVAYADKHSYLAEQYKVLRTNLYSMSPQVPHKTIVITSSQSQEGKSITTCNLAYTLSLEVEKKIILIDSDFRKPAVHKLVGVSRKPGFTDILGNRADIESFVEKPMIDNLYVIPSGTLIANPSEFLSSAKMKDMLEYLKSKFDVVLFDTPPVINVTDSCILGSLCDCVLLVVKAGTTPKNMVEEAYTMLRHAQAKPKACILTETSIPVYYYYLSRYKYYYNYRYGYRKEKPAI